MNDWYLAEVGRVVGPFSAKDLLARREAGELPRHAMVRRDKSNDWLPIASLAEAASTPPSQTEPLAYSPPPVMSAASVVAAASVVPDDGPFLAVGQDFTANGRRWDGSVFVSPLAFYCVKDACKLGEWAEAACVLVPVLVVGGFLAKTTFGPDPQFSTSTFSVSFMLTIWGATRLAAFLGRRLKKDDFRTCTVADLPAPMRAWLDPDGARSAKDVIVLPREVVRSIWMPAASGTLRISLGGVTVSTLTNTLRNGPLRKFLALHGWAFNVSRKSRAKNLTPFLLGLILAVAVAILGYQLWLMKSGKPYGLP